MPGDRLTSPEAAKESAERDVDVMPKELPSRSGEPCVRIIQMEDPGELKQVNCQRAMRFAALRRLFL